MMQQMGGAGMGGMGGMGGFGAGGPPNLDVCYLMISHGLLELCY